MIYVLQIDLSFSCVCPVIIDHEFRHNIAKVAADPWGDADYFDSVMMEFIICNRTDTWKTQLFICFLRPLLIVAALHKL